MTEGRHLRLVASAAVPAPGEFASPAAAEVDDRAALASRISRAEAAELALRSLRDFLAVRGLPPDRCARIDADIERLRASLAHARARLAEMGGQPS